MKVITLHDFLTDEQLEAAKKLYLEKTESECTEAICDQIVTPNIVQINEKLGQENDPKYLAYCIYFVFNQLNA